MKSYLITDPLYYGNTRNKLLEILNHTLRVNKPNYVCFRDKSSKNYEELAKIFVDTCKNNKTENILLNQEYLLAHKLEAHGVHLTSKQFNHIKEAKALNLFVIISCHTEEDIKKAIILKADAVSYSPIFDTPNKGKNKGIEELIRICNTYEIKVFALGGIITKEHLQEIKKSKAYGFASIRYFI
ncbi:MAG: thiamine phosphate synthase [Arcobacter sp.]|nr:MAG: thiamine phosphate synthase [Arcobacter sp.]